MRSLFLLCFIFSAFACMPRRETAHDVYKERAYHETVSLRAAARPAALATNEFELTPLVYYLLEPEYSCDVDLRVGEVVGDGAKYLCNPHLIAQRPSCLYYGFGVNGNIHFDLSIQNLLHCEMHTFDPTPSVVRGTQPARLQSKGIHFHGWGISGSDSQISLEGASVEAYTFLTIKSMLGHSSQTVDIVKIDVEGSEWVAFHSLFLNCDPATPYANQFLVEVHDATTETLIAFHDDLARCGYRAFHKDANLYCPACMEYAFVHWKFLKCQ